VEVEIKNGKNIVLLVNKDYSATLQNTLPLANMMYGAGGSIWYINLHIIDASDSYPPIYSGGKDNIATASTVIDAISRLTYGMKMLQPHAYQLSKSIFSKSPSEIDKTMHLKPVFDKLSMYHAKTISPTPVPINSEGFKKAIPSMLQNVTSGNTVMEEQKIVKAVRRAIASDGAFSVQNWSKRPIEGHPMYRLLKSIPRIPTSSLLNKNTAYAAAMKTKHGDVSMESITSFKAAIRKMCAWLKSTFPNEVFAAIIVTKNNRLKSNAWVLREAMITNNVPVVSIIRMNDSVIQDAQNVGNSTMMRDITLFRLKPQSTKITHFLYFDDGTYSGTQAHNNLQKFMKIWKSESAPEEEPVGVR
jgi:hypothetical protein